MDLQDQLKHLFPDHKPTENDSVKPQKASSDIWVQDSPISCKYEKRKGKPTTIIEGYTGTKTDFKILAKTLKTTLNIGGSIKDDKIILQGDYRDNIMNILSSKGFKVKRVGG